MKTFYSLFFVMWAMLPTFASATQSINNGVILVYHHVDTNTPPSTSVSPQTFREHMQYLSENHNVIALEEMVNTLRAGELLPDKSVAITFDDGYLNILENGHPILTEFGFPYTIFINTDLIGQESYQLTWEQVKQMKEQGVSFANHTRRHDHLLAKHEGESEQRWLARTIEDVEHAQSVLSSQLGQVPKYVAYPYGEYNLLLADTLATLGYVGFGQHSGAVASYSDFTALPRFAAAGVYSNLKTLKTKLNSLAMPVTAREVEDPQLTFEFREPLQTLQLNPDDFRMSQVACYFNGNPMPLSPEQNRVNITQPKPLRPGRSRINCTAPSKTQSGRYYWYSQPWFVPTQDGKWLN